MAGKHARKRRFRARRIAIAVCVAAAVGCGAMFALDMLRTRCEDAANSALQQQVHALTLPSPAAGETPAPAEPDIIEPDDVAVQETPQMLPQYEALWRENPDLVGWLTIEGTRIDYPVLHTPDDPEHYLRRAFDGSSAVSGSLFLDADCTPGASSAIIYGHNMRSGSMFGTLDAYADEAFAREHPTIRFDTLYEQGTYEVLAAFYSTGDGEGGSFRYFDYADLTDPALFDEYVAKVAERALYDTGVTARYGDSLLTLSTCSSALSDGRFVVVARRVK